MGSPALEAGPGGRSGALRLCWVATHTFCFTGCVCIAVSDHASVTSWVAAGVTAATFVDALVKAVRQCASPAGCLFGHDKNWLAVAEVPDRVRCTDVGCCNKMWHEITVTKGRWICRRGEAMGEEGLPAGAWKVEFGRLVPDEKAWSNF